ncbi:MAG TPA: DNA recombination protein RmuC [Jatrophihabitans sp.]|jgi:DNA recombination protein RmuC
MEIALLAIGLVVGVLLGWALKSRGPETQVDTAPIEALTSELEAVRGRSHELEVDLTQARTRAEGLTAQLMVAQQQFSDLQEQQRREVEAREKAAAGESKVLQQLAPVADQLKSMQSKVAEIEKSRAEDAGELKAQIEATQRAARASFDAANTLSTALRDNSVRGAWGETQLKTLVESAGLVNHVNFDTQTTISDSGNIGRPDMVVRLPGGKALPIDSKVPYTSYVDAQADGISADQRRSLLLDHAKKIRGHVDALAKREYPRLLEDDVKSGYDASPDFTIAFIPSDTFLGAALELDPSLLDYAFSRSIVLATPSSLWSILKAVAYTWRQENIAADAAQITEAAREFYRRLVPMAKYIADLGKSIDRSAESYNKFVGSLEQRVLPQGRALEKLDTTKELAPAPIVETSPRQLAAPELLDALRLFDDEDVIEAQVIEEVEKLSGQAPDGSARSA